MSYDARNSGTEGLGFFELIAEVYDLGGLYIEASPIYQTLDRSWSISGSYEDATYEYDYSYSITLTQLVRESVNTSISYIAPAVKDGTFKSDLALSADLAEMGTPNTDKFYMFLSPGVASNGYFRQHSPLYQTFEMQGALYYAANTVIGTRTRKSDSTVTDLTVNITIQAPFFRNSSVGFRDFPDEMVFQATNIGTPEIDITSYTVAQWRDFRGVYEFESTNSNGITTTAFWTIGGGMGLDFSSAYNSSQLTLI